MFLGKIHPENIDSGCSDLLLIFNISDFLNVNNAETSYNDSFTLLN